MSLQRKTTFDYAKADPLYPHTDNIWSSLRPAVKHNDLAMCKLLIDTKANPNQCTPNDKCWTASCMAVERGYSDICKLFINAGFSLPIDDDFNSQVISVIDTAFFQISRTLPAIDSKGLQIAQMYIEQGVSVHHGHVYHSIRTSKEYRKHFLLEFFV